MNYWQGNYEIFTS